MATLKKISEQSCWSTLYSKGCVILFFAGSMVGVMSQYFGEPIQCDFKVSLQLSKDCTYRDGKYGWYVGARNFFLLLLNNSRQEQAAVA